MSVPDTQQAKLTDYTTADVEQLAQRLDADDYETPLAALGDWHLLRAVAFQRPELAEPRQPFRPRRSTQR
ncbi:MAG: DUF2555 domain-containing protein, partial [Cyanobacteria bacterium P01_A01_bin.17]